ncbi:MAG: hypothetical protein WCJ70_04795 [bacterium]
MDHANPLPPILTTESIQKPKNSPLGGYVLALVVPFIITVGLLYAYSRYSNNIDQRVSFAPAKKIIRVDDGTFGLSTIGSEEEYRDILMHLTPTPRIVADTLASFEADLRAPAARDPFAPAIIDLQKSLLPSPAKLLADGSTLYASQNGKTYVLTSISGKDPRQASIIPEGGTLLSSPDALFILSAEAPGSSRLSAYQTKDPTKPTKLWTLTTSQTSRIVFSTLYKDELVLGISSSLTTGLPCAMTIATIYDKPVDIDCATILSPTTPFIADSIVTIIKIRPDDAQIASSISSFAKLPINEPVFAGADSLYVSFPIAERTGIAQISLSDLSVSTLQVQGKLATNGALYEMNNGKLVAVTELPTTNNWNLIIAYSGTFSGVPTDSLQKVVSKSNMYALQNHLLVPPTSKGDQYRIIDLADNSSASLGGAIEPEGVNTQLYQLEGALCLMTGTSEDDTTFTVFDLTTSTKPVKVSYTLFEKYKAGIGPNVSKLVINKTSRKFYMRDLRAVHLFSYSTSGIIKLLKTFPDYTYDQGVIVGSRAYFLSEGSIDSVSFDDYIVNRVVTLN